VSSPKHDLCDVAARFARKARSDEITLDKLADDPDVPDDVIGFHTQQAVEKLLKAALACAGVAPPRIHDLGELIALLGDADLSPPASASEARALVPWAVEFRYDDMLDERLDRVAAREAVARLRSWLDGLLPRRRFYRRMSHRLLCPRTLPTWWRRLRGPATSFV
jgi:HEPN domain-containing protein